MPRKNRSRPLHQRFDISDCRTKVRYSTRHDAESASETQRLIRDTTLRSYHCPYCSGWHLTSRSSLEHN